MALEGRQDSPSSKLPGPIGRIPAVPPDESVLSSESLLLLLEGFLYSILFYCIALQLLPFMPFANSIKGQQSRCPRRHRGTGRWGHPSLATIQLGLCLSPACLVL